MARQVAVVGGGFTGLAIAHRLHRLGVDVTVCEGSERAGGLLRSARAGDWLVEWGANGFLDDGEATLALVKEVGIEGDLVPASPASSDRFVVHDGRLHRAPLRPQEIITTPLLPLGAKLRLLREPRVRPRPADAPEESLATFVRRRFGEGTLHLADAFVSGIHAGDPERLSLDHAFPALARMEREHGSVLRALRARGGKGARRPRLTTLAAGMESLPRALAAGLPARALRLGDPVVAIRAASGRHALETAAGRALEADAVVVTLPPNAAARLLPEAGIPEQRAAPLAVVGLGYAEADAPGALGFGFLAPEGERRFALGVLHESHLFPGRAPEGHVLLRAIVGGVRHPERVALPDADLVAGVRRDLEALGVARGEPAFATVARPGTLPQIEVGHEALLGAARRLEASRPGLLLGGLGWRAVSLNGLAEEAERLAKLLLGG